MTDLPTEYFPIKTYLPTLCAADQVACEFVHKQRVEFLAQAIRREHDDVDEPTSRDIAHLYATVDRGFA